MPLATPEASVFKPLILLAYFCWRTRIRTLDPLIKSYLFFAYSPVFTGEMFYKDFVNCRENSRHGMFDCKTSRYPFALHFPARTGNRAIQKSANKIIKEVGSPRRSKNRTRLKATPNENAIDMFQRTKRLAKETLG